MSSGVVSEMLIRIAADTAQLRSEMEQAKRTVGDGFESMRSAGASLRSSLLGIFAGISAAALVKEFVEAGDAMALLDARLKNAVGSGRDFAAAQADIYRIAQANNIGLQEAATLYTKLHDPVTRLGGTTRETGAIVESFALSLRLGGASTQEAAAATLQFAQAMGSGKLQGDEFRSIAEASPRFMRALADGMGVPIEKLKELGSEGKLTADVIGNALMKSLGEMKTEAESLPDTVGGAFTRIKNDILVAVNELNQNSGLTLGIADFLETVRSDVLPAVKDELAGAFESVGEWIDRNRKGIGEIWDQVKDTVSEVWQLVRNFGSVLGFVIEIGVKSGTFRTIFESVRLIVAGIQDGMDIIVATFSLMGAQILRVIGLFSDSAKAAAREAEAAGLAVVRRFANGDTAVQRVIASINQFTVQTEASTVAQRTGTVATNEADSAFRTLRSSVADNSEESKKAKAEYDKLMKSIRDKTAVLAEEGTTTEKLTDGQKLAIRVQQDLNDGTLRLTASQREELRSSLDRLLAQERNTEETKKAKTEYDKMMRAIQDKTASLIAEESSTERLTDAQKLAARIEKDLKDEKINFTAAQREELRAALDLLAQTDRNTVATKEATEAKKKATEAQIAETVKLRDGNTSLQEQNDKLRLGDTEFAKRQIRLLELKADELDWQAALDDGNAALSAQANALRERARLLNEGAVLQEAKKTADEWQKTADSIQQGLTDSLFRAAESGKSIFESLRDGIKGMFNNLVLKPIINAVMKPIAGGITSFLGIPGAANAAGSAAGGGGILDSLGSISGFGSLAGSAGLFGSGFTSGLTAWAAEGSIAGLLGSGSLFAGGLANGLGLLAGSLGPIALGVMAVMALMGEGGGPKSGGQSIMQLVDGIGSASALQTARAGDGGRYIYTPDSDDTRMSSLTQTALTTITDMVRLLGGQAANLTLGVGYDTDPNGKAPTRISSFIEGGVASDITSWLSWNREVDPEQLQQELANEVQRLIVAGLIASDLPASVDEIFAGIDPATASIEALNAALQQAAALGASVQTFNDAVRMMPFENLKGLSFDAAAGLIELAGGIENLLGQIQTYYENFYTEPEQAGITAQQALRILEDVGISGMVVENRAEFRALFESLNANTEEGRRQIAAMLQVAGAMANVFSFLESQNGENAIGSIQELIAASPQVTVLESILTPTEVTAAATESIATAANESVILLNSIDDRIREQTFTLTETVDGLMATVELNTAAIQQMPGIASTIASASNNLAAAASRLADSVSLAEATPVYTTDIGAT